jgi:hypothetical protein
MTEEMNRGNMKRLQRAYQHRSLPGGRKLVRYQNAEGEDSKIVGSPCARYPPTHIGVAGGMTEAVSIFQFRRLIDDLKKVARNAGLLSTLIISSHSSMSMLLGMVEPLNDCR